MNKRHWLQPGLGLLLIAIFVLPPVRHAMEITMWRHMLVQFPLWIFAGALLAAWPGDRWRARVAAWNSHGIAGFTVASITLTLLMVPRLLDLALYHPDIEALKLLSLLLTGAALRLSWQPAGLILQSFFFGGMLAIMATVGMLYMDSPLRLCNAYLHDDQVGLGRWLTISASIIGAGWLFYAGRILIRQEQRRESRPHVAPD